MKKVVYLSHSLITAILREQCSDIANLFDNSLTPTTEQVEDLQEITRAWLADMPDTYQEKFNNGFQAGFEMAQQLSDLDAEKEADKGFSVTFNMDEELDETARKAEESEAQPETEEDAFRHYVSSPEIPDSSNSSENSNSSNDSEVGITDPTNLIAEPVEKNSQPNKERNNPNRKRAEELGITLEDFENAISAHGINAFAEFCGVPVSMATATLANARRYGYPGPKTIEWIQSLSASHTERSEKLTAADSQAQKPQPAEPKRSGPTQVISFGRARSLCRTLDGQTDLEKRFIKAFQDSGLDSEAFISTLQELQGMAVIP